MIMSLGLSDREPDRNDAEKRWIGNRYHSPCKILADAEP
jgi:hypothetical protein